MSTPPLIRPTLRPPPSTPRPRAPRPGPARPRLRLALSPLLLALTAAPVAAATIRIGNVRVNQSPSTRNPNQEPPGEAPGGAAAPAPGLQVEVSTTPDTSRPTAATVLGALGVPGLAALGAVDGRRPGDAPAQLPAQARVVVAVTSADAAATLNLKATDGRLAAEADLGALPPIDARLTVALHDARQARVAHLTGRLDAAGRVRFDADPEDAAVRLLDARLETDAAGRPRLALQLGGPGVVEIARGEVAAEGPRYAVRADLALGAPEQIWSAPLPFAFEGVASAEVRLECEPAPRGPRRPGGEPTCAPDRAQVALVPSWLDDALGVWALGLDADPQTELALQPRGDRPGARAHALTVTSRGWDAAGPLPSEAELTFAGGTTWTLPATAYQRAAWQPVSFDGDPQADAFEVVVDGQPFDLTYALPGRGLCQDGLCLALTPPDPADARGSWALSATTYATRPADLRAAATVTLVGVRGTRTLQRAVTFAFEDEVAVVFAAEADLAPGALGAALDGRLSLRAGPRGRLLGVRRFSGAVALDGAGQPGLAARPGPAALPKGDILIGGEPIGIERTAGDEPAPPEVPPAVLRRNGTGTRNTAASTNQTQQTHLL